MNVRSKIEFICSGCGAKIVAELNGFIDYTVVRCRKCGASHHIHIDISIRSYIINDRLLDEFEDWLYREKRISSAREYRRYVERYIKEGKFPRSLSPLMYFNEYARMRKLNIEIPIE